jgi:cytochrome c553
MIKKCGIIVTLLLMSVSLYGWDDPKNGEKIFTKCSVCHGFIGEKSALNMSKPINLMPKFYFIDAIKGYQDGSYGRDPVQKKMMKTMVENLTDSEISDISTFLLK